MGCGGWLGPEKQIIDIYITYINQIHEEALKTTSNGNLDLYMAIKEKLTKKGYIRKLNDYLTSHRTKINDALAYNLKKIYQKKDIENRFAAIMIADSVIESTYKKIQPNDIAQSSQVDSSLHSSKESSLFMTGEFPFMKSKHTKKKSKSFPSFPGEFSEEINSRIDDHYIRMINFLLENENRMYHRILLSLENFCLRHTQKIRCEHEVWKIIKNIIRNLENDAEISASVHAYYLLLSRLKDTPTEQMRNQYYLEMVIKLWLKSSRQSEITVLYQSCRQIIRIYINRCLNFWDSQFIYEIIMKVYDFIEFQPLKFQALQALCESAVQDLDIKIQFYRGIFNYLLSYLSVTYEDVVDKKWFSMALGSNYDHLRATYKNILDENIKIKGFKIINKWIDNGYVNLDEFMLYSSKSLIFVYSSNIKTFQKKGNTCNMLESQYSKMMNKLSVESQQIFKKRVVDELKQPSTSKQQQQILLKLIKQMLYKNKNNKQDLSILFIPLKQQYDQQIKLEILKIVGFVLQNLETKLHPDTTTKYYLCEFMATLSDSIIYEFETLLSRYQLVCSSISFCKILIIKYDKTIILAYIEYLTRNLEMLNMTEQYFFLKFYIFELSHILFKNIKVPDRIFKITQEIHPQQNTSKLSKIQSQISTYLSQSSRISQQLQINSNSENHTDRPHSDQLNIQHLFQVTPYDKSLYRELSKIFNYFNVDRESLSRDRIKNMELNGELQFSIDSLIENDTSQIQKNPFLMSRRSSLKNDSQDLGVNDRSFEEVLEIVNE